jgi:hypothetical protein
MAGTEEDVDVPGMTGREEKMYEERQADRKMYQE